LSLPCLQARWPSEASSPRRWAPAVPERRREAADKHHAPCDDLQPGGRGLPVLTKRSTPRCELRAVRRVRESVCAGFARRTVVSAASVHVSETGEGVCLTGLIPQPPENNQSFPV